MSKPYQYGAKYWIISGEGGEIGINADTIEVHESGALIAWGGFRKEPGGDVDDPQIVYSIAHGQWHTFYAASILDGRAVCSEDDFHDC